MTTRPLLTLDQLAEACRNNDDDSGSNPDVHDFFATYGLDHTAAIQVAEQRALRAAVLMYGTPEEQAKLATLKDDGEIFPIRCPREIFRLLVALYLDGLMTAARAITDQTS